jgi:N6-adenosine-specific RNA methylase IME4
MIEGLANAPLPSDARRAWADRIAAAGRSTIDGILAVGRLLSEAKAQLPRGEFEAMIGRDLPFKPSTAQRLMKIAADERLSNPAHVQLLPPHWGTLYELSKLDDARFAAKLKSGEIHPDMQRRDIIMADKRERRTQREAELAARQLALPDKCCGVLYSDCAWRFEVWSRETGMDRAADNHYLTMKVAELIALKDTLIAKAAAADCVHFMWTTRPMFPEALKVMMAWGFDYKTCFGWEKTNEDGSPYIGAGYWARDNFEALLVGTRGSIPAPALGTQWPALIKAPVIRGPDGRVVHSAKPSIFYELIEAYFPNLPKIELFARQRRAGWDPWGLEAPMAGDLAAE